MLRSRTRRDRSDDGWPAVGDPRRISAPDLDSALAMARLRFGTYAKVAAARRVSRGVSGFGGKVSVEVWVETAPTTVVAGEPHAVGDDGTLESLLARADAADTVSGRVAEPSVARPTAAAEIVRDPHPAPDVVADPVPPTRTAIPRQRSRRWSKAALGRLGVPTPVLAVLTPPDEPTDPLWVAALAGAIATSMPEPCLAGVAVAHGTGGDGALMLLRAGLSGVALGTLTTSSGPSPATPVALAVAIGELL